MRTSSSKMGIQTYHHPWNGRDSGAIRPSKKISTKMAIPMKPIMSAQLMFFLCFGAISSVAITGLVEYKAMQASNKTFAALIDHVPVDRLSDITVQ